MTSTIIINIEDSKNKIHKFILSSDDISIMMGGVFDLPELKFDEKYQRKERNNSIIEDVKEAIEYLSHPFVIVGDLKSIKVGNANED